MRLAEDIQITHSRLSGKTYPRRTGRTQHRFWSTLASSTIVVARIRLVDHSMTPLFKSEFDFKTLGHRYSHRPRGYLGALTMTLPGIYRPAMVRPSGGVSRNPPEGNAGWRRSASYMTLFICLFNLSESTSCKRTQSSSSRSLCICSGLFAR